jgi:hypothetical protein
MLGGDQRIAIPAPGHQAILQECRRTQLLDQEQSADEKQQDDHDTRQTRGLPLGGFMIRVIVRPMVMSIQRTLPLERRPLRA